VCAFLSLVPHASQSYLTTGRRLPAGDTLRLLSVAAPPFLSFSGVEGLLSVAAYHRRRIYGQLHMRIHLITTLPSAADADSACYRRLRRSATKELSPSSVLGRSGILLSNVRARSEVT